MAPPKTIMLLLYLILYSSFSRADLDDDAKDQTEKALALCNEIPTFLDNISKLSDKLEKSVDKAGETLSKILKAFDSLAKIASAFSFIGAIISFIFAFIPQSNPVLEQMKVHFAEVNRKLDSLALQISSLHKGIKWTSYTTVYLQDENKIQNSWDKLQEFLKSAPEAKTKEEKVRMAERFTTFYESTATENSVANFYRYLTVKEISLKENLLDLVTEKFKGDFKVLLQFSTHFTGLMIKGLQLDLYYYALKGYNDPTKAKEAVEKLTNVLFATEEALINCIDSFEKWAIFDTVEIGTEPWSETKTLASDVQKHLQKKFSWYDWMVIVYDSKAEHEFEDRHYLHVNIQGKANVLLFHRERGAVVDESIKNEIVSKWQQIPINTCLQDVQKLRHELTSSFGNVITKHLGGVHAVNRPDDYVKTDDKGHVELHCQIPGLLDYRKTVIVFLKGKDVAEEAMCTNVHCQNGLCKPIKDTTAGVCKCDKMYYGPTCEDSVHNDLDWEMIQSKINAIIIQPVPDLTAIYFSIKDLKEYTKHLAYALQTDIEWTQIFVKYSDLISKARFFSKQYQLLEQKNVTNDRYVSEIKTHVEDTTFRYMASMYNDLMMGTGFGDKSNILDAFRNALLLERTNILECSKTYADQVNNFIRYMFALEKEYCLAWFKYLMLTAESEKIQEYEKIIQQYVSQQWRLFNKNGCGSLTAERLSNSFCDKPYHSTQKQKISIHCMDSYHAHPQAVTCSEGKWSDLPVCYTKPKENGDTTCKSERGKTVCTASCKAGWSFSDGQSRKTYECSKSPCQSFTPPSCDKCVHDSSCKGNEVCRNGKCQEGCSVTKCGANTVCSTSNHVTSCSCQSGWSGDNPREGCQYRDLQWVSSTHIPQNAVTSFSGLHVCRTKGPDGAYHGGWIRDNYGTYTCNYDYDWKELRGHNYEVLVDPCPTKGVEWKNKAFYDRTVVIGKAAQWDINYYVCSCGDHVPGKLFNTRHGFMCHIGYNDAGSRNDNFYSLVQRPCV